MAKEVDGLKLDQKHGKSRVRVGRVWRKSDGTHLFVEWNCYISLVSDCLSAYANGDNPDIVATDTMKNTVYVKAKECPEALSMEEFAIDLGRHFTSFYRQVTAATIKIVERPWERLYINGQPHRHGFKLGSEKHTTEVTVKKSGSLSVTSGIEGLTLLKTTQDFFNCQNIDLLPYIERYDDDDPHHLVLQLSTIFKSGFEGFIRDKYTALPETRERMLATEVSASWRYPFQYLSSIDTKPHYFTGRYDEVKKVLVSTFFGPLDRGVYSPSVQSTLFDMGRAVLSRFPDVESIQLRMPNIHFLPVNIQSKENPAIVKFEDDVYLPTDEPHGTIEASLSRSRSKI